MSKSIDNSSITGCVDTVDSKVSSSDIKFVKAFDKPKHFYQKKGSKIIPKYEKQLDSNGNTVFKKIGERNLYEEIQMFADQTDINAIIARCIKETGSIDILAAKPGDFQDVSELPSNLYELLNLTKKVENEFYNLPLDERELFNNNPITYVNDRLQETAVDKIKNYRKQFIKQEPPIPGDQGGNDE